MILITLPRLLNIADQSKNEPTQKIETTIISKTPAPKPTPRLYQGILVTENDEKDYLELLFQKYGLQDRLPEAIYTIQNESSWLWYADNGVSRGLGAFTKDTWVENCSGSYEAMNPQDQLNCFAKLWAKGEWGRWDSWCLKYEVNDWRCESRGLYKKY